MYFGKGSLYNSEVHDLSNEKLKEFEALNSQKRK